MPLIGTIDKERAQMVMESLLSELSAKGAEAVILDITGVSDVDAQVASALVRTAQAAQLLGTEVILTGIKPEVAQALVELGAELGQIRTLGTLQSAVAAAMRGRRAK